MSKNKLKVNPDTTGLLLIGDKRQWSKYLCVLSIEHLGVKANPAKSAWNLGVIFNKKYSPSNDTYVYTTSGICSVFATTLIWIAQNYLQMVWCLPALITEIHLCLLLQTLTSPNFSVIRIDYPHIVTMPPTSTCSSHCFIPFIGY